MQPNLSPLFEETPILTGESTSLFFDVELFSEPNDDSLIYAYTTIGGFAANDRLNNLLTEAESVAELEWFSPPKKKGEAELYVIVEDGQGAANFWTGLGIVE